MPPVFPKFRYELECLLTFIFFERGARAPFASPRAKSFEIVQVITNGVIRVIRIWVIHFSGVAAQNLWERLKESFSDKMNNCGYQ